MLIEKAWAKIFGNYEVTEGGMTSDVMNVLTGAPCVDLESEDPEFMSKMMEYNKKHYVITGACYNQDVRESKFKEVGLVPAHAYSVLNVYQEKNENILEIRNPWGWESQEWTGKWSDSWAGWTSSLRQKYSITADNKDDGRFFMCESDFKKYFDYVTVCKVHDLYYRMSTLINQPVGAYTVLKMNLSAASHCFFMLNQRDQRFFRKHLGNDHSYSFARIFIVKKGKLIDSICKDERITTLECNLEEGDYEIFISVDFVNDKRYDANFSYYGAEKVTMSRTRSSNDDPQLVNMAKAIIEDGCNAKSQNKQYSQETSINNDMGCVLVGFTNVTDSQVQFDKKLSLDPQLLKLAPFQSDFSGKVSLLPRGTFVLYVYIVDIYENVDLAMLKSNGII